MHATASSSLEAVLPYEATRPIQFQTFLAAEVPPQRVAQLIKLLAQKSPLPNHLKRVKNKNTAKYVLLLRIDDKRVEQIDQVNGDEYEGQRQMQKIVSQSFTADVVNLVHDCLYILERVPKHAPVTRAQFEEWTVYWPIVYHDGAAKQALTLWASLPCDEELVRLRSYMRRVIDITIQARVVGGDAGKRRVGALLVRPASEGRAEQVIAEHVDAAGCFGYSPNDQHPGHPLHHSLMLCISSVASLLRQQGRYDGDGDCNGSLNCTISKKRSAETRPNCDYLCKDCDAFVLFEPCAMCAMALVHSRIRRLFYAIESPGGALGSRYRVHTVRSLNHHYQVVRGLLRDEAIEQHLYHDVSG